MGVEVSGELVTSILVLTNAVVGDAGSYSCTLPVFGNKDFPRARANVHLIYGEFYWQSDRQTDRALPRLCSRRQAGGSWLCWTLGEFTSQVGPHFYQRKYQMKCLDLFSFREVNKYIYYFFQNLLCSYNVVLYKKYIAGMIN